MSEKPFEGEAEPIEYGLISKTEDPGLTRVPPRDVEFLLSPFSQDLVGLYRELDSTGKYKFDGSSLPGPRPEGAGESINVFGPAYPYIILSAVGNVNGTIGNRLGWLVVNEKHPNWPTVFAVVEKYFDIIREDFDDRTYKGYVPTEEVRKAPEIE